MTAEELLTKALAAIQRSGTEYDTSGTGSKRERSAARIAQLFGRHTGIILTNEQVWCFMQCVKLARLEATPNHEDSLVDLLAYRVLELEELSGGGAAMSVCAYCGEEIEDGQLTAPGQWGDAGDRMHIDCPVVGEDGQDLSLGMGDS